MIDINKKYKTRCGYRAVIYTTEGGGEYPVHGATYDGDKFDGLCTWRLEDGRFNLDDPDEEDYLSLVEINPYEDFVVDEPVLVRDCDEEEWKPRHFSGVGKDGRAGTWVFGTRWTSDDRHQHYWKQCIRPVKVDSHD